MKATNIAFAHHKGGTGKTTSCINMSGYLAKEGKKVLVVDLDPQANATSGLGIDKNSIDVSMYEAILGEAEMEDVILKTGIENIHLAPATLDLVGAVSYLYRRNRRSLVLRSKLKDLGNRYDYVMIDTPPGPGLFIINGVVASDYTIITLDPSIFALEGIETLSTIFDDINESIGVRINPLMAILTRCRKPSLFSRITGERDPKIEVENGLKEFFEKIYTVPYSIEIYEAQFKGVPISHYQPSCKAGLAYKKIVNEVIKYGKS